MSSPSPRGAEELQQDILRMRVQELLPSIRAKSKLSALILSSLLVLVHNLAFTYPAYFLFQPQTLNHLKILDIQLSRAVFYAFLPAKICILPIFSVWTSRKLDPRFLAIWASFAQSLLFLIFAYLSLFSSGAGGVGIVVRILQGLCSAAGQVAGFATISHFFRKYHGTAAGMMVVWVTVGLLLGPYVGLKLFEFGGFSTPSLVFGGVCFLASIAFLLFFPAIFRDPLLFDQKKVRKSIFVNMTPVEATSLQGVLLSSALSAIAVGIFVFLNLALQKFTSEVTAGDVGFKSADFLLIVMAVFSVFHPFSGYLTDLIGTRLITLAGLLITFTAILFLCFFINLFPTSWGVFLSILILSAGNGFLIGSSIPDILSCARTLKRSNETAGTIIVFALSLGELLGFLIGYLSGNFMSFTASNILWLSLIGVFMIWFFVDVAARFMQRRNLKRGHTYLSDIKEEEQFNVQIIDKMQGFSRRSLVGPPKKERRSVYVDDSALSISSDIYSPAELYSMKEKCEETIEELLTTEENYFVHLSAFMDKYMRPMKEEKKRALFFPISNEEIDLIEKNINTFIELHSMMHKELQNSEGNIIPVFQKYMHFFKIYASYVVEYENILMMIAKKKRNNVFKQFLKNASSLNLKNNSEFGFSDRQVQTFESYLIMPIQRIPRYILLLKEIQKNTPKHRETANEHGLFNMVISSIQNICNMINESDSSRKQLLEILELQDKISGEFESLVKPHRKLIRDGLALRKTGGIIFKEKKICLYLFNDILLYTSRSHRFKGIIELTGSSILPVLASDIIPITLSKKNLLSELEQESEKSFHLIPQNLHLLTLVFATAGERISWEESILKVCEDLKRTIKGQYYEHRMQSLSNVLSKIEFPDSPSLHESEKKADLEVLVEEEEETKSNVK